ncbi:MAG: ornithine/acetylornithine aminotransferase [Bacteroidetes bacterium]|nr:MAG: ornithine/acetylornithine aminotransferase [Bacteroidota bacterium]
MLTHRQLFQQHLAQTSPAPLALEIVKAEGSFLFDADGKKYTDLISGIAVSNVGHRHPRVLAAIHKQLDQYMHLMVYGEYVQAPQVKLAHKLAQLLPAHIDSAYFVNSGAEAIEGAMKLAKRYTGRPEIVSFKKAYHGSTQGALSLMGDEFFKDAFRPLLPGIRQLTFNDPAELAQISENTAAVFVEPVQGEAGAVAADPAFMQALRKRCDETGTLLVFDEIQTGFGRTGKLFALEHYGIIPDMVVLAKGMGGGMPLGAFAAPKKIMQALTENPVLGHITTFGGHPVCCAAALATIEAIIDEKLIDGVEEREQIIRGTLKHEAISEVRGKGLMLAVLLPDNAFVLNVIQRCVARGVITDWFLFCDRALRIAPPLNIAVEDLREACTVIVESIEEVYKEGVLGN